jgi:hypothetical protein
MIFARGVLLGFTILLEFKCDDRVHGQGVELEECFWDSQSCWSLSAMAEFMVRVLHSRSAFGIHNLAAGHTCD